MAHGCAKLLHSRRFFMNAMPFLTGILLLYLWVCLFNVFSGINQLWSKTNTNSSHVNTHTPEINLHCTADKEGIIFTSFRLVCQTPPAASRMHADVACRMELPLLLSQLAREGNYNQHDYPPGNAETPVMFWWCCCVKVPWLCAHETVCVKFASICRRTLCGTEKRIIFLIVRNSLKINCN